MINLLGTDILHFKNKTHYQDQIYHEHNIRQAPCLKREPFFGVYAFFWQENEAKILGFRGFISSEPKAPRNVNPTLLSTFKV